MQTVEWFRLLWDLIQRGHTLAAISDRTQIAHSTLRGYLDGSEPPHWRGERLIALWCQTCAKDRSELPMMEMIIAPRVVHRQQQVVAKPDAVKELERVWR